MSYLMNFQHLSAGVEDFGSNSIWAVNKVNPTPTVKPTISQEVAKGGRLQMDEVFNQMEELDEERRSHESDLGLVSPKFNAPVRGKFDVAGISSMLSDINNQYILLKNFTTIAQELRENAGKEADGLAPDDYQAMVLELVKNKKEEADLLRVDFKNRLASMFQDWESAVAAIQRVITVSPDKNNNGIVVKLELMPYLLQELAEAVRVSRLALFAVRIRYNEVMSRKAKKAREQATATSPIAYVNRIDPFFFPRY